MHVPIPQPTPLYNILKDLLKKKMQKTVQVGIKPTRLTWRTYIEESKVNRFPKSQREREVMEKCGLKTRAKVIKAAQLW